MENNTEGLTAVKTGVFVINHFPGVYDDLAYNTINIDLELRDKEYFDKLKAEHELPDDYDFGEDPQGVVDQDELDSLREDCDTDTKLYGFKKDVDGLYVEDPEAEYSCQFGELYGFVTASKYICKCNKGSPCIPYQCDLESEGSEWAFTLPPEVFGDEKPDWMEIVKLDHHVGNLTGILFNLSKTTYVPY